MIPLPPPDSRADQVLALLRQGGQYTQSEISRTLDIPKGSVPYAIVKLKLIGWPICTQHEGGVWLDPAQLDLWDEKAPTLPRISDRPPPRDHREEVLLIFTKNPGRMFTARIIGNTIGRSSACARWTIRRLRSGGYPIKQYPGCKGGFVYEEDSDDSARKRSHDKPTHTSATAP